MLIFYFSSDSDGSICSEAWKGLKNCLLYRYVLYKNYPLYIIPSNWFILIHVRPILTIFFWINTYFTDKVLKPLKRDWTNWYIDSLKLHTRSILTIFLFFFQTRYWSHWKRKEKRQKRTILRCLKFLWRWHGPFTWGSCN